MIETMRYFKPEVKKEKHRINNISLFQSPKEYVERRHNEPNEFLFLPKMGLLGSQASDEKKSQL